MNALLGAIPPPLRIPDVEYNINVSYIFNSEGWANYYVFQPARKIINKLAHRGKARKDIIVVVAL